MAKKSKIARNEQRKLVVERYAEKRLALKKALVDPNSTENRDAIDGRSRGVLAKFGVSRIRFRDMAHRGELPGITKSSW